MRPPLRPFGPLVNRGKAQFLDALDDQLVIEVEQLAREDVDRAGPGRFRRVERGDDFVPRFCEKRRKL